MESIRLISYSVAAAVLYGIAHDEVTARVCVEYFTVAHPRTIAGESPTLLGLYWGVVATWWVGLPLGIALAAAARAGSQPQLRAAFFIRPLAALLVVVAGLAFFAGVVGFIAGNGGWIVLWEPWRDQIAHERHARFLAAAAAHAVSYATGILGGLALIVWATVVRRRAARWGGG